MLTLEKLQDMEPHSIFARGKCRIPHPMKRGHKALVKWVAVRGSIADWSILYGTSCEDENFIKAYGTKIIDEKTIRKIIPCDDLAFQWYRY